AGFSRRLFVSRTTAALAFLLLAILQTWPLARNLSRAVAGPGDPYLNIWILDWDYYATLHHPLSLFHANAFHPARYSLAFTEHLYGIAFPLIPLRLAGAGAVTAYNFAMLAGFAFSGFGAYLLALRLTRNQAAAFAAGVFYAFVPFRMTQVTHIQHVWGGWLPILLLALINYVDRPSRRTAAMFGAVFVMNGLTNIHWFLFGSFAVALTAGAFVLSGFRRWREIAIATAAALLLLAPFLYPYTAVVRLYGIGRGAGETKFYSAFLSDWLVSPMSTRVYSMLTDVSIDPERWLFPGAIAIVLAAAASLRVKQEPRAVVIGWLWILLGVAGSLGLNFFFHDFLYEAVPGFRAIRVPARWAAIAYVGLAIMIAVATAGLAKRKRWLAWAVPILLIAELHAAPIRWFLAPYETPQVYRWLATQPRGGAVLELPIESDSLYLLHATAHHRKLVNPPRVVDIPAPGDELLPVLRKIGCELIVVHADALGRNAGATRAWLRDGIARGQLGFVRRFDGGTAGDWVFRVSNAGHSSPELDAFLEGRFTRNAETFGTLDVSPRLLRGSATFSGFAFSPAGIRSVDLLFEQGRVRLPATLIEDRKLAALFPWYPATQRPRFVAHFPERPRGVRPDTDVEIEITDGAGRRIRTGERWLGWQ
ncbi:MAG: hypothetical protein JJE51_05720, partial [Thermoanaerobaculia bacterium]|nr:hypothetical protein [Thermoanaerobaculia bacterium]